MLFPCKSCSEKNIFKAFFLWRFAGSRQPQPVGSGAGGRRHRELQPRSAAGHLQELSPLRHSRGQAPQTHHLTQVQTHTRTLTDSTGLLSFDIKNKKNNPVLITGWDLDHSTKGIFHFPPRRILCGAYKLYVYIVYCRTCWQPVGLQCSRCLPRLRQCLSEMDLASPLIRVAVGWKRWLHGENLQAEDK